MVVQVTTDLAKCMQSISGLQSIKLDGCSVTTSAIKGIGNWLASLKELSLSKCSGITDECLSFLVQTHKELRKLDITCCRKITYASIDSITNSCTFLTSLKMESCSLVSKDAFELIGQRCRLLKELDVTDNDIDNEGFAMGLSCPLFDLYYLQMIYVASFCRFEVHIKMFQTSYLEACDLLEHN
jgi:F-box/leucine-rich repeat protein 2/20